MSIKRVVIGEIGRSMIAKGVKVVRDAVGATMGYAGRTVMIDRLFGAYATKDGVSVANEIKLKNPFEDMGAQMVIQAATGTAIAAGDGTTTATVLTSAMYLDGFEKTNKGFNATEIKKGMQEACSIIEKELDSISTNVKGDETRLRQIAYISSNGDEEVADIATKAVMAVGEHGDILIKKAPSKETKFELSGGYKYNHGMLTHYFETERGTSIMEYEDAKVLIIDDYLQKVEDLSHLLVKSRDLRIPLVIVCKDVDNNCISALARSKVENGLMVGIVSLPDYGEMRINSVRDLAESTGTKVVTRDAGITVRDISWEELGEAKSVKSTLSSTTFNFSDKYKEKIDDLADKLKSSLNLLEEKTDEYVMTKERYQRLTDGIVTVSLHAVSDVEFKEKYDRTDDAINAVKSAVEQGVIDGGGLGLYKIVREYEKSNKKKKILSTPTYTPYKDRSKSFNVGIDIVIQSCKEPINKILSNAGVDVYSTINKIEKMNYAVGFNVASMEYENLKDNGIIDPTKVTKTALKNSVSVSSTLLTTEAFITNENFFDEN